MPPSQASPRLPQFPQELVTYGGNGQVFSNWAQVWAPDCVGRQGRAHHRPVHHLTLPWPPAWRHLADWPWGSSSASLMPEIPEVRGPAVGPLEGSGGPRGGTWGQCGDPLTTPVPRSPAVLADNVLPGPDDRGADTGHVQRTPAWPFSQQPRGPQAGHHQWDGGSRGRGEAQPPPTCQAVAPESQGAAPSPLPTPLLQVIPSYSSRTEYEKLFAMGVTM